MSIPRSGDLVGTKDGVNDTFTIPVIPIVNSERIIFNGNTLHPVGTFTADINARNMECIISGQTVQIGLPPKINDKLSYSVHVAD